MARMYLVCLLCVIGFAKGHPTTSDIDYIENIRSNAIESRIVGGLEAYDGQFPSAVSLRMVGPAGGVGACGGSILTNQWILTAAHCLARRFSWVVRYGVTNLTRPDYIVETTERYIHEGYNQASTAVQIDDIGLLKVNQDIPYAYNIKPIRLQSNQRKDLEYEGVRLTLSGFGRTDDWWLGGYVPEILYWVYQLGISQASCLTWYPNSQVIGPQSMCSQYYNETSQNACTGDSGGALTLVDVDGEITQVGIMSFAAAVGCNTPNPQGFVRPEHYHDWIEEQTGISFDWNVEDLAMKQDLSATLL